MTNFLPTEESDRMLIDNSNDFVKKEINLEPSLKEIVDSEDIINVDDMKHVDSSSGHQEEDDLHLGILVQELDPQTKLNSDEFVQDTQKLQFSMIALSEAVAERKAINFKSLNTFVREYIKYHEKHMGILIDLETQLLLKLETSRQFIKQAYSYFYILSQIQPINQINNLSSIFLEEEKKSSYAKIIDSLKNIILVRQEFQNNMSSSSSWLNPQFLVYLNQLISVHQNSIAYYNNEIYKSKLFVGQKSKNIQIIFKQIEHSMLVGNGGRQIDLLSEELRFFEIVNEAKLFMIQWGTQMNTLWLTQQKGELNIISEMVKHIASLYQSVSGLFQKNDKFEKSQQYWNSFNAQQQIKESYYINFVLSDESCNLIQKWLNKPHLKNEDFERFIRLEHDEPLVGNPQKIKQSIILKKFKCKVNNPSTKKLQNVLIYSSIDGYVVFSLQQNDKLINTMNLKNTISQRLSHHLVQVKQKRPGFFRANWNKLQLQFATSDEAQEFLFFTAQNQEEQEGVLN